MSGMKSRMLAGELYLVDDPELAADQARAQHLVERFNATSHADDQGRRAVLAQLLGAMGDGVVIKPTLRCDYGYNISVGAGTFINYDCILLDVVQIVIGQNCQVAPRVQLLTATHPVDPSARRAGWELGRPISIGDNVWLGAGAIVCPDVTIGDDTVIGAGSVVARSLPAGVVAVGSPARVVRAISDTDQ